MEGMDEADGWRASAPGRHTRRLLAEYLDALTSARRQIVVDRLKAMAALLDAAYDQVAWHALSPEQIEVVRARMLMGGVPPETVNEGLNAIRGAGQVAYNRHVIDDAQYHALQSVQNCRTVSPVRGRAASSQELAALFSRCAGDRTAHGVRDLALLSTLYAGALHGREVVALALEDYLPDLPGLRVAGARRHRQREVLLGHRAADALAGWVAIRGRQPGRLFLHINRSGRVTDAGMSTTTVKGVLRRRTEQADLKPLTLQDMRHTAFRDVWAAGADLLILSRFAGEGSLLTVLRYCRQGKRWAPVDRFHQETPYHRW